MIHSSKNDRSLNYKTPLIEYIRSMHSYSDENLIYTNKYSNGTFSITNPTSEFRNCEFINGYPHFNIPLDVCLEEINFFLSGRSMYDNDFYIRYGDTHPHKCVPKLAQVRNLLVENSLSSMIGKNAKSFYAFGDISLKSLEDFRRKAGIYCTPETLFIDIVNNRLPSSTNHKFREYTLNALREVSSFLKKLDLPEKEFLIESNLYRNQELYHSLKTNSKYLGQLKQNGELKYSLQELMFIRNLVQKESDVLINVIGANQIAHVIIVNDLLKGEDINNRFLSYEICRNADERDVEVWSSSLNDWIAKKNMKVVSEPVTYQDLLKSLMIVNSNDVIIDFNKMDKYYNQLLKFYGILESLGNPEGKDEVNGINDLICKMALVGYSLNRSVEMGNPNNFYKYLTGIVNEYESNKEKYTNISELYISFIAKGFERLGYYSKVKELTK